MSISASYPTTRPSLLLDFSNSGRLDPRVTFSRTSGATWFNSVGQLVGIDFSSTSLTIGTGTQTLTLTATAGVDRYWATGDTVILRDETPASTNLMNGTVVSYTASTQVLVVSVTSVSGSGTFTSWRVSSTMPRFDYNPSTLAAQGLLIEEARTNTATYSTEFQNAVYLVPSGGDDVTITDNAATSLDGTTNAASYTEGTSSTPHARFERVTGLTANGVYTLSLFVKDNTATRGFGLGFGSAPSSAQLNSISRGGAYWSTLAAGPATSTYSNGNGSPISTNAVDVGNGWFRLSLTFTFDTTNTNTSFAFGFGITAGSLAIGSTGDGSSYLVYGFQLEEGAFPTSYIPTVASTVTRAIDVAQVNTLSPWFNASEGTLYAQAEVAEVVLATRTMASFAQSTPTSQEMYVVISRVSDSRRLAAVVAATSQFQYVPVGAVTSSKGALAYKTDDTQGAFDGTASPVDTSVTLPTGQATLYLGNLDGGGSSLNGWLKRVAYYPRRLSQAELETITS